MKRIFIGRSYNAHRHVRRSSGHAGAAETLGAPTPFGTVMVPIIRISAKMWRPKSIPTYYTTRKDKPGLRPIPMGFNIVYYDTVL